MKKSAIQKIVRKGYAQIATNERHKGAMALRRQSSSCCSTTSGCGCGGAVSGTTLSNAIGYSDSEMESVPEGANLGLGCGNPLALASLKKGETVLDLGSGPGLDCFLAANKVGKTGKVIGIDMTPEMIAKARANAKKGKYTNVEFRLGEIEKLPVEDNSADIIISNCVINLSPDKPRVFKEAFRALKPGGRLMVSDIVITNQLPEELKNSIGAYVGCLSGAIMKGEYLGTVKNAGFKEVKIVGESEFPVDYMLNDPQGHPVGDPTVQALVDNFNISSKSMESIADSVVSVKVSAIKPAESKKWVEQNLTPPFFTDGIR